MSIQHKDIPDSQRHPPKGFEGADSETVQVKNNVGALEWRKLSEMGAVPGPPGDSVENLVVVQKNPGLQQFADPIAAMASILDASSANPYVLLIGPGIYQLSAPLVLKEGVTVLSMGNSTVVLEPSDANNDIVQINTQNCRIMGMTLRNATGPSAAAVRITAAAPLPAVLDYITIQNCTEEVVLESSSSQVQAVLRNLRLIAGSTTKKLLRIVAGGQPAIARIYSAIITDDNGTAFEDAVFLTGVGARLDANTALIRSTVGVGNGIRVADGAELVSQSGAEVEGFNKNLCVDNSGANPIVRTTTIMLRSGVAFDLHIQHPGTMGSILAKANVNKVMVDDSAPVKLLISDPVSANPTGQFIRGDMLQADLFSQRINLSKLVRASSTMGRFSGGAISDDGGFNVRVAAGNGFLLDSLLDFVKEVNWIETVLTILSETSVYVYINSNGIVSQSPSLPDLSENVVLGRVSTSDAGIHIIQRTPMEIAQFSNKSSAFFRGAFGPIYVSGSQVAESGTRNLDVTPGNYWFGVKNFLPLGGTAIEFEEHYRKVGSGYNIVTGVTQVNNTQYDDGSGTLASLGAGKFATHALYSVGDGADEKYMLQFSQAQYDSLVEAEGADIPTPPTAFGDAVVLIARIITEQGNAALRIYDARSTLSFKAPGVSAAASHANLFGLLNDDHPQYLLANGGRAMSGNLNMGGNNIGNVGTVDGVDVSAHGSRHAPSGADPIPAGTPSTITDNTNDAGNSNDVARGNHSHSHGNRGGGSLHAQVTTSANGFMSAADKTKLDGVAPGATANQTDAFLLARANHTGTQPASTISDFDAAADARISAQKGQNNGLATLDGGGKVPAAQLPSFVDDVLEFANLAGFPVTGETSKIYTALDTGKIYRWSGSAYVEISASPGSTDAVPEGATNLYFTVARVLATLLTGLNVSLTGAVTSADTILQAFGRIQNSLNNILNIVLTGYVVGANTALAATDTILQAFGKIQGQINANVAAIALRALASRLINTGYGLTGGGDLTADRTLAVSLAAPVIEANSTVASTNVAGTIVTGFTVTPPAGTYFVSISARIESNGNNAQGSAQMYVGGVAQANTIRPIGQTISFGTISGDGSLHTQKVVTVNGSQAIDLRWSHTAGGFNMLDRSIICVRLA